MKKDLGASSIEISWRIPVWFPELGAETLDKLKNFHSELLKGNRGINLISVKTIPVADAVHFADGILSSRLIAASAKIDEIFDVGSGNGFPGVVFAILFPTIKVHLVEVDPRKAEFLKGLISTLKLSNCDVLIRRVEDLDAGCVKFAMTRGLAPISKVILMSRRCVCSGGLFYHLKGEEWAREIAEIPTQLCSFWSPSLCGEYKLPVGPVKFAVVITKKIVA